jgi:hypothetical protein
MSGSWGSTWGSTSRATQNPRLPSVWPVSTSAPEKRCPRLAPFQEAAPDAAAYLDDGGFQDFNARDAHEIFEHN